MPAAAPSIVPDAGSQLIALGAALRAARKQQRISAVATAEAAGISRPTLHRIERGEPGVAAAAWAAVAQALGQQIGLVMGTQDEAALPPLPQTVHLADYPQLRQLAWQLQGVDQLSPQEALQLYERNWRHVDKTALSLHELVLVRALAQRYGTGDLLV